MSELRTEQAIQGEEKVKWVCDKCGCKRYKNRLRKMCLEPGTKKIRECVHCKRKELVD